MDVSKPLEAMLPAVDSAVLAVLARSEKPRTGREIARVTDRSQPGVQRVLNRLVEQGLVHRTDAGSSRSYMLNREHIAAGPVEELANIRPTLFKRLRELIAGWSVPPVHASVFGSAARGDGTTQSDIDIFLVRPESSDPEDPAWRAQLDEIGERVLAWTGNHTGIAEVGESDLAIMRQEKPAVIAEVEGDAVELAGATVGELFDSR
jgi:DNA-binding transcriptional ArsR family regulator